MPIRYTLEQVNNIFSSNNCKLLDNTYTNQLTKLNYIATCGHENIIDLKMFLMGNGIKCRSCALEIPNYQTIATVFSDKGCCINLSEDEFYKEYKNNKTKLQYTALCGHINYVSYSGFKSLNQGINCPSCVIKNTGAKLHALRSGENKNSSIEQEFECIKYFIELTKQHFQVIKTFDGCNSDIALKPISNQHNLWLGIQVKTTSSERDKYSRYSFKFNNTKYDNCLILCICIKDKKLWLIPYEEVKDITSIGISKKSKYNQYEVTLDTLQEKLLYFYETMHKFDFDILNTPTSSTHKQEKEYRKIREQYIDFLEFVYPNMEGTVYDFKIGDKKVQEKVGFICKNNPNSFGFSLNKSDGRTHNCSYKPGDNEFYWLNCKNNSKFYIIPEKILVENGFIGEGYCRQHLYISPTNKNTAWCNNYLFDYNNLDKERFLQLM
jgi:hypothetical protein